MRRLLSFLVVLLLLAPVLPAQDDVPDFDTAEPSDSLKRKRHSFFIRPAKELPAEQLEHARSLAAAGRLRRASRQFDALVREWHDLPEAAEAQHELAVVLERRRKYIRAFEAYQYLIDFFEPRASYADILDRQFRIANQVVTGRSGRDRALPLFEALLQNAPEWDRSMQVRYALGTLYRETGDYDSAAAMFQGIQFRDPDGLLVEPAAHGYAACMYRLARQSPRDKRATRSALSALVGFLSDYPGTEHETEIREQVTELKDALARMYYDTALFYDRQWRRHRAALQAYRDFVRKFPNAKLADRARERIRALEEKVEASDGA